MVHLRSIRKVLARQSRDVRTRGLTTPLAAARVFGEWCKCFIGISEGISKFEGNFFLQDTFENTLGSDECSCPVSSHSLPPLTFRRLICCLSILFPLLPHSKNFRLGRNKKKPNKSKYAFPSDTAMSSVL